MSKTTVKINKITNLLQSVSGLYLDDDPELEKILRDTKRFVKRVKQEEPVLTIFHKDGLYLKKEAKNEKEYD